MTPYDAPEWADYDGAHQVHQWNAPWSERDKPARDEMWNGSRWVEKPDPSEYADLEER